MKMLAIYSLASGQILRNTGCADEDVEMQFDPETEGYLEGRYSDAEFYVEDGQPVSLPPAPSEQHQFNWVSKTWEDPRTLDELKQTKMLELKASRDNALKTFTWDGSVFQMDEPRMLGLKVEASEPDFEPVAWRLADNSWRVLTAADALAVYAAGREHLRNCFMQFAVLEVMVNAVNTVASLEAISWPS